MVTLSLKYLATGAALVFLYLFLSSNHRFTRYRRFRTRSGDLAGGSLAAGDGVHTGLAGEALPAEEVVPKPIVPELGPPPPSPVIM